MGLHRAFTEHPASVDETYGEHMRVALGVAGSLAVASGAAIVHALVPALCEKAASKRIRALHETITSGARGAADRTDASRTAA